MEVEELSAEIVRRVELAKSEGMNIGQTVPMLKEFGITKDNFHSFVETAYDVCGLTPPEFPNSNLKKCGLSRVYRSGKRSMKMNVPHMYLHLLGLEPGDYCRFIYDQDSNTLDIVPLRNDMSENKVENTKMAFSTDDPWDDDDSRWMG